LQQWTWPTEGEDEGYILGRAMPGIGVWKKWSPNQITKIAKKRNFEKPNPTVSDHTIPTKSWKMALLESQGTLYTLIIQTVMVLLYYLINNL
jgi:hypothetical protein